MPKNHKGFEFGGEVTVLPRTVLKATYGLMKTTDPTALQIARQPLCRACGGRHGQPELLHRFCFLHLLKGLSPNGANMSDSAELDLSVSTRSRSGFGGWGWGMIFYSMLMYFSYAGWTAGRYQHLHHSFRAVPWLGSGNPAYAGRARRSCLVWSALGVFGQIIIKKGPRFVFTLGLGMHGGSCVLVRPDQLAVGVHGGFHDQ